MTKLKIGDKIEIKKEEKISKFESTFTDILVALKSSKLGQKEKLKWCSTALEILEMWFMEDELKSVKVAKKKLIPILENLVEKGSIVNMASFFELYKRTYCFCAKRDLECFIDYMEWESFKESISSS